MQNARSALIKDAQWNVQKTQIYKIPEIARGHRFEKNYQTEFLITKTPFGPAQGGRKDETTKKKGFTARSLLSLEAPLVAKAMAGQAENAEL